MTPQQCAAAVREPVDRLGSAFMFDPATAQAAGRLGLRTWPMYYLGRGGVLGDVPGEIVASVFTFFPPAVLGAAWAEGRAVLAPLDAATEYAGMCAEWGRVHLAGQPDVERAVELVERVVGHAQGAGLPLFTGWRLLPLPQDPPGRLAQLLQVLREHRGGVHVAAVAALGLDPLTAVLLGRRGEANAVFFRWPKPYPDVSAYQPRRDAAEDLTEGAAAPPYDALSAAERVELAGMLARLQSAVLG